MDKAKLLKLAKMIMKFATYPTDKAELIADGELAAGVEVYVEVEGEIVAAEDGEYAYEDKKIIVKDGKVEEIVEVEKDIEAPAEEMKKQCMEDEQPAPEEPQAEEPKTDERDAKIAELEAALAEKEAKIAELEAKIKELEDKVAKPVEEPIKEEMKKVVPSYKQSGALKYFQD